MPIDTNTQLDQLLARYNKTRDYVANKLVGFEKSKEKRKNGSFATKKSSMSRYARRNQSPSLKEFKNMVKVIGCSPKELYSTLKQSKEIDASLRDFNESEYEKNNLLAKGWRFVYIEEKGTNIRKNENGIFVDKDYAAWFYRESVKKFKVEDTFGVVLEPKGDDCNCLDKSSCQSQSIFKIVKMVAEVELFVPSKIGQFMNFSLSYGSPSSIQGYFLTHQSNFFTKVKYPVVKTVEQVKVDYWVKVDEERHSIGEPVSHPLKQDSGEWHDLESLINQNLESYSDWQKVALC